jgi:hypothetical protein
MQRVNVADAARYVFFANCNRLWFMFKELNWLSYSNVLHVFVTAT